ncbi:MAG: glycosyltransferase family 4 protein [Anaeromyxobacteraceae bacterium]
MRSQLMPPRPPLKWLSFSAALLPQARGGTEVYVARLAEALASLGVRVTLASYGEQESPSEPMPRRALPPIPSTPSRWQRWSCHPFREAEFAKLLREVEPDVVHFHGSLVTNPPEFMAAAKSRGAVVLWTFHAPGQTCLQTALLREGRTPCDGQVIAHRCARCTLVAAGIPTPLAQLFGAVDLHAVAGLVPPPVRHPFEVRRGVVKFQERLNRAVAEVDLNITHADWTRELLLRNGALPESIRHLALPPPSEQELGLNFGEAGPVTPSEGPGAAFRLLFAGRFIDVKGLHLIARAFAGPLRHDRSITLTVLGIPGVAAYETKLRALVGGDPRVTILESAATPTVFRHMRDADAVVVPSTWLETGPYTVLEAQLAGAAVVGTDLGGIRELTREDPEAYLFKHGDVESLADSIRAAAGRRLSPSARLERSMTMASRHRGRFTESLHLLLRELASARP